MTVSALLVCAAATASVAAPPSGFAPHPLRWGEDGHRMTARAAASALPEGMPTFFVDASEQLAYLNPEPDRWRSRPLREMDQAWSYDHYIDLENVPAGALDAPDRFRYLAALYEAGLARPERDAGFLPFRIVELYQRLVTEWRLWRAATGQERRWIEERIVHDAGVLGHYVSDASQPHHTTIHFNGWNAGNVPGVTNPEGFTESRDFHGRFESDFVRRHVDPADVADRVAVSTLSVAGSARQEVVTFVRASHARVEELYRIERDHGFDPAGRPAPEATAFAVERLAAGAEMLRTLWWSAWIESAEAPGAGGA